MEKMFRRVLWLSMAAMVLACSGDETTREENGGGTDVNKREIIIELQNGLRPEGGTTTRADKGGAATKTGTNAATRAGGATSRAIAEEDENQIRTLDIYAFAATEEDGQYTLADRFCYRAGNEVRPAGTQLLDFQTDETNGRARAVFYPRKGLFYHFYCIANHTQLLDESGTPYTAFTPLKPGTEPVDPANPVISLLAPGTPTESDFLRLLPAPLTENEVIRPPLMMSGATTLPIDLRNPALGSSIRLNMRLTRAVARIDVVNNALESHLTITAISMDRGRNRVSLFPIAPVDAVRDGETSLITYADAPFEGPDANLGATPKAFYCYPSPASDGGALVVKGLYAPNQTDAPVDVAYRIPFEQTTDGTGMHIDVVHNHRYTLHITRADAFKLDNFIQVEDWADEGNLDQQLDNDLDEPVVSRLQPDGKTLYDPLTNVVTMSLDPAHGESSFVVHTASNTGVVPSLNFVLAQPSQHWLKLEEMTPDPDYQHRGSQAAKFKVTVKSDYDGDGYPRAVLRLTDGSGKYERLIAISPEPLPVPLPATPLPDTPGEKLNLFDQTDKVLHLYRVKGSTTRLRVTCPGDTEVTNVPDWLQVERTSGTEFQSIFTLTLLDPDIVVADDKVVLTLRNKQQPDLEQPVTVLLHEAEVTDLAISDHSNLSDLDATQKEIDMTVTTGSQFRLTARAYDDVTVDKIEYTPEDGETQVDEWLEYSIVAQTAAANATDDLTAPLDFTERMKMSRLPANAFTRAAGIVLPEKTPSNLLFKMKQDAQYFGPAKLTLKNTCLGPDLELNIKPVYPMPVVSASTPMEPSINYYDEVNHILYMLQQAAGGTSRAALSVYAPGGSKLILSEALTQAGITLDRTEGKLPTEVYHLSWSGTNDLLTDKELTLTVQNRSDATKQQVITVKALAAEITDLTLTPKETGSASLNVANKAISIDMKESNSFTLSMKCYGGQVGVEKCPSFLAAPTTTRAAAPAREVTTLTFTLKSGNANVNGKGAEDLVLTNPSGGPKLTLRVTPVYIAPVVSGSGTMTPANGNKWDAGDNTLYLLQQAQGKTSSGILTIYSLGGSTLALPQGVTASLLNSDEKSQQYTLNWAGSNANNLTVQNLTLTIKNKSDLTKTKDVKLQLLPNVISDLALTPKASGTATLSGTTVTVDIATGNWFKLTMKAYGNNTRVQVKSKPAWLTASTPAVSRTAPAKEQTALTFTVDDTKTDFTQGNLVLTNPSGGPDLTILVKPKYLKPTYNSNSALSTCNNYVSGALCLIQPRTGASNGTLRFYSLGGSQAELINTTDGLAVSGNALTANTLHDYILSWKPSNPNNARGDQNITLRVWNKDKSQYLDQPIKLIANGAVDIYNDKYKTDQWDVAAKRSGVAAISAGLSVNIVANATFEIHTNSYGGMTLVGNPAWVTPNKYEEKPAITTPYATKINTRFRFTIKSQNGAYPTGNITLRPVLGGPDFVVTINPVYQAPTLTAGTMNPNGVNNYDATQNTVYLVQQAAGKNSTAQFSAYALGGSKVTLNPANSGLTVSPANSTNATNTYTLTWAGNNTVQQEKTITVTIANNSDNSKTKTFTAKLLPNTLRNVKLTAQTGNVSLNPGTLASGISATLTVPIVKDAAFTVSMECYGGTPQVKTCPAWLQKGAVTRAAPANQTHTFRFNLIENAANFNDTQIVFTNPSGGPELTLNITRQFQAPVVTYGNAVSPSVNYLSGNTVNVYRTKASTETTCDIQVYSLGGSDIETNGTSSTTWFKNAIVSSPNNYTRIYRVGHNNTQVEGSYNSGHDGTFNVRNASDTSKKTSMNIHFIPSRPTFSSDGDVVRFNNQTNSFCYFDIMDKLYIYGRYDFKFKIYSPAGVDCNVTTFCNEQLKISKTTAWSSSSKYDEFKIEIRSSPYIAGNAFNMGDIIFKSKISGHFYDFKMTMVNYVPIANGYWASLKDNNTGKFWYFYITLTTSNFSDYTDEYIRRIRPGWHLPSEAEWQKLIGATTWPNDENWYTFPTGASNIIPSLFPADHWVKCATNNSGYRIDIDRSKNSWSRDWGSMGNQEKRIYIISD